MSNNHIILQSYNNLLDDLSSLIKETESKVVSDQPDDFVIKNVNFFTKSFMITLCAYLESFLKDISMTIIDDANEKLSKSKIAYSLVKWSVSRKKDLVDISDNDLKPGNLSIDITKTELGDFISGSPYKTEKLFKKFGISLVEDSIYLMYKEKINSIVVKRNKIIHHNDTASDITFLDVAENIKTVMRYIENISDIVEAELNS